MPSTPAYVPLTDPSKPQKPHKEHGFWKNFVRFITCNGGQQD